MTDGTQLAKSGRGMSPEEQKQMEVTITEPDSPVAKGLLADFDHLMQSLRQRAYELFERRGRKGGSDLEDWLQAEAELLFPAKIESTQEAGMYTLRVGLPEFSPEDIQLYTIANNLILKGTRSENTATDGLSSEQHQNIFYQYPLPADAHVDEITAEHSQGTLTITIPLVEPATSVPIGSNSEPSSATATAA
jgi:HSP20 family molecular chaperone IbpA